MVESQKNAFDLSILMIKYGIWGGYNEQLLIEYDGNVHISSMATNSLKQQYLVVDSNFDFDSGECFCNDDSRINPKFAIQKQSRQGLFRGVIVFGWKSKYHQRRPTGIANYALGVRSIPLRLSKIKRVGSDRGLYFRRYYKNNVAK